MKEKVKKRGISLPVKIMIALVIGIIVGVLLSDHAEFATTYIKPFGDIFLSLIKMVVVPLVFASLITGVGSLSDIKQLGRFGLKTVLYFMFTTAFAVAIGLLFANVFNPAGGFVLNENMALDSKEIVEEAPGLAKTIIGIVPTNPFTALTEGNMLQIIVFAIIFGIALLKLGEKGQKVFSVFETIADAMYLIVGWIMKLAPIGVFALIVPVIAENGAEIIGSLLKLILVAYAASFVHAGLVYGSTVSILGKMNPIKFFRKALPGSLTAFSTSSSSGALPVSMECANDLGVSKPVASFVLPLGATINMDGTAIYQGVCVIFIAKVFGIDLSFSQQLMVILSATLASIGTAGVPGAGMIMLTMVLQSVGLPVAGIALVAGIDRPLDMIRTAVNVTGDMSCAVIVARSEGELTDKD